MVQDVPATPLNHPPVTPLNQAIPFRVKSAPCGKQPLPGNHRPWGVPRELTRQACTAPPRLSTSARKLGGVEGPRLGGVEGSGLETLEPLTLR